MPIKIGNDAASIANVKKQLGSPKFFSKDITGSGKTTGLLSVSSNPDTIGPTVPEQTKKLHWHVSTEVNKHAKLMTYPIDPLGFYVQMNGLNFDTSWCQLDNNCYASLTPVSLCIEEPIATAAANTNTVNNVPTGKKITITYKLDNISETTNLNGDTIYTVTSSKYTENPFKTFTASNSNPADANAFQKYLATYSAYDAVCKQSVIWQTTLTDAIISAYDKDPKGFPMGRIIRYISQYKVSLQQYRDLYAALKTRFNNDDIKTFTKMNTSLLLQDTLENLANVQFPALPAPGSTSKNLDLSWCSKEQFDAITSFAPLNQVQAGAGTGKSTVIKARLDYLDFLGVDMNKVMVLSFTNAAADNIKARCPGIQSMTIAKMIDTIYQTNHPTHQLSPSLARRGEGSTFTNSLTLYRGSLPYVEELIDATNKVEKYNDYATLLRLVEEHYDDVMNILDTVQQTTFHLEIIICYLEYATMHIPFDIEYLLIDEVQDNAVFEFIFFLNLTCKLKNHLYLVGDCSQTLYEFRASDPKALNAIENSGLFSAFPLNINYRSNQNILSFANALLDDIEANQYANIQLQSFKLNQITKQSFVENVTVDYTRLNKISDMAEHVYRKLHSPEVLDWINDKLAKHEQICVLAYKRREAAIFQKELEALFPNRKLVSIIPAKNVSFAYFSRYVCNCRQQMMALPTNNADDLCMRIRDEIITNLGNCYVTPKMGNYTTIVGSVQSMCLDWEKQNKTVIVDDLARFQRGEIDHAKLIELIGESLINYEIQKNALKQTMMSQKNAGKKEGTDDADFIFSTIHSAKGLEFDNVILLYQNKNQMEEDAKRMYYVALTRAKKSEYIIAYDTTTNALIYNRYENVIKHLPDANAPTGYIA